ncbi:hypothetical protein [Azonexus sp.]|uniref:hypothetical protein n=1 Tax=Azonexus sp. TaxID=1872668 RepID=UPI0035B2C834
MTPIVVGPNGEQRPNGVEAITLRDRKNSSRSHQDQLALRMTETMRTTRTSAAPQAGQALAAGAPSLHQRILKNRSR